MGNNTAGRRGGDSQQRLAAQIIRRRVAARVGGKKEKKTKKAAWCRPYSMKRGTRVASPAEEIRSACDKQALLRGEGHGGGSCVSSCAGFVRRR